MACIAMQGIVAIDKLQRRNQSFRCLRIMVNISVMEHRADNLLEIIDTAPDAGWVLETLVLDQAVPCSTRATKSANE